MRRLLGPLLAAPPGSSGWVLTSWDGEQGISLTFERGPRALLVELEARDDALDCYARTRLFNVCARLQSRLEGDLAAPERALVESVVRFVRSREGLVTIDTRPAPARAEVREVTVERALVREQPGRYYLNPYAGCMVGCSFCYVAPRAELSRRLAGSPPPAWGRWVDVKINAPELLAEEIRGLPPGLVRISPILTDPYQPVERRYRITRRCLEVLLGAGFTPIILTREARVLDDLALFARHPRVAVGFSIPTDDERLRQAFEPGSDPFERRFAAVRALAEAGVTTAVVVQPALPMDVAAFVARVAPWVRVVRIDRMYFSERVAARYEAAGIAWAATPAYQDALAAELRDAFLAAGVLLDERDDLAGVLSSVLDEKQNLPSPAP